MSCFASFLSSDLTYFVKFKDVSDKCQLTFAKEGNSPGWVDSGKGKQVIASNGKIWRSDAYVLSRYDSFLKVQHHFSLLTTAMGMLITLLLFMLFLTMYVLLSHLTYHSHPIIAAGVNLLGHCCIFANACQCWKHGRIVSRGFLAIRNSHPSRRHHAWPAALRRYR